MQNELDCACEGPFVHDEHCSRARDCDFEAAFRKHLSPAALQILDEKRCPRLHYEWDEKAGDDAVRFVASCQFFARVVQYPVRDWYVQKLAEVFNMLVDKGLVKAFLAVGSARLASGVVTTGFGPPMDLGPDEYASVFMFFHSTATQAELNAVVGGGFVYEGNIGEFGHWWGINQALAAHAAAAR